MGKLKMFYYSRFVGRIDPLYLEQHFFKSKDSDEVKTLKMLDYAFDLIIQERLQEAQTIVDEGLNERQRHRF